MKKIFEDYGIIIMQDNEKYYIQYDAGELVDKIDTIEVSKEDAEKAQIGEENAYNVILQYQKLWIFLLCITAINKRMNFNQRKIWKIGYSRV